MSCTEQDAALAIQSLHVLLEDLVARVARRMGFTREQTSCWSVIVRNNPREFPDLNPPVRYERRDPL